MINIKQDFEGLADPKRAEHAQKYFKTSLGEYGEGDIFLGLTMPKMRQLAKKYQDLPFEDIQELLDSKIHEHRMTALVILTLQYPTNKKGIFDFYLKNTKRINNWDLVDVTCPHIVGDYLLDKDRSVFYELARSDTLWERRIAIVATSAFIRKGQFEDTLKIAEILLKDKHDLIHKAVGWMLREIGKRDQAVLEEFLEKRATEMPRTMLRYAIEKFSSEKRQYYLKKK